MNHVIRLSLDDAGYVKAYPNPLPKEGYPPINFGDTVIWVFDSTVGGKDLQVVFSKFYEGPVTYPCNPYGPFSSLEIVAGGIVGKIRLAIQDKPRRFLYDVYYDGRTLPWKDNVEGGIDIPMTPMMED